MDDPSLNLILSPASGLAVDCGGGGGGGGGGGDAAWLLLLDASWSSWSEGVGERIRGGMAGARLASTGQRGPESRVYESRVESSRSSTSSVPRVSVLLTTPAQRERDKVRVRVHGQANPLYPPLVRSDTGRRHAAAQDKGQRRPLARTQTSRKQQWTGSEAGRL